MLFSDGLLAWFHGEENPEADAAGETFAEILLMHRNWLKNQFK